MGKIIAVCLILLCMLLLLAYIKDQLNKLLGNAKPSGQIQFVPQQYTPFRENYELYADVLISCVNNNCKKLGLQQPKDRLHHYAPIQERVYKAGKYLIYSYIFDREFDISSGNGLAKIKNPVYVAVDNSTIRNTLNGCFPDYCIDNNLYCCQIYGVSNVGNSRIRISIIGETYV